MEPTPPPLRLAHSAPPRLADLIAAIEREHPAAAAAFAQHVLERIEEAVHALPPDDAA